jgi:hypothetical protein
MTSGFARLIWWKMYHMARIVTRNVAASTESEMILDLVSSVPCAAATHISIHMKTAETETRRTASLASRMTPR